MYMDMSNWEGLVDQVFAEKVKLDYVSFYGGKPYTINAVDQVEIWKAAAANLDTWQHVVT